MNKFNSIRISENNLTEYLHAKFPLLHVIVTLNMDIKIKIATNVFIKTIPPYLHIR